MAMEALLTRLCDRRRFLRALFLGTALFAVTLSARADAPGGFLEQPGTAAVRARLAPAQIQSLLPARGKFTFPAPYNTQALRLTNASDCGGADCLWYVGYSYWRNMNNHVGSDILYIFLGLDRTRGGGGPTLFGYNKVTEEVRNLGPLFDAANPLSWATGEGWYFSATQRTTLYLNDGPRMQRYDVESKQLQTVYDATSRFGAGYEIWQMHSSDDDRVHSATLRNATTHEMLGCLIYHEDSAQFQYFPKVGDFDECNLDRSGRWAISLETTQGTAYGDDMRVFDLATGSERRVLDQNGAVGHADMGYGYVVGTDNWNALPNAIQTWDFTQPALVGRPVFYNTDWAVPAANHISHTNAQPGVPMSQQYACGSNASPQDSAWGNEIVCFRLDGSFTTLVVAPVMTDMGSAAGGDEYAKEPKGNLDVTGQYFLWTSNSGGSRVDAFIAKVPSQLLMGGGVVGGGSGGDGPVTPPTTTPPTTPVTSAPAAPPDGGRGNTGGGCTLSASRHFDPFPTVLLYLAAFRLWRRRGQKPVGTTGTGRRGA
jgi:hypothetical protein